MKQRIRVTAICKNEDDVLLLKRAGGRVEGVFNFELPTGKIVFGEQPEEAMARVIYENLGVQASKIQLTDVVTFTGLKDSSEQGNLFIVFEVQLQDTTIKLFADRYSSYKWVQMNEVSSVTLAEESLMVLQITGTKTGTLATKIVRVGEENKQVLPVSDFATIYTDGGSRGNPGPSGLGYYIIGPDGKELKRGGEFLGFSTSRLAEYYGLKEGLEQAIELGLKRVHFKSDSLMMVNQMNGIYKVKNPDLMQIHADVLKLLENLEAYSFTHVPRELNVEADAEVNKVIDANMTRKLLEY
ncbi:reverse transcriptase-like protein [Candidatus Saccharibacteria bacterium]|nr:reverse transcriptase-like protein [Candidatus Saccharibacteria bacterium]